MLSYRIFWRVNHPDGNGYPAVSPISGKPISFTFGFTRLTHMKTKGNRSNHLRNMFRLFMSCGNKLWSMISVETHIYIYNCTHIISIKSTGYLKSNHPILLLLNLDAASRFPYFQTADGVLLILGCCLMTIHPPSQWLNFVNVSQTKRSIQYDPWLNPAIQGGQ